MFILETKCQPGLTVSIEAHMKIEISQNNTNTFKSFSKRNLFRSIKYAIVLLLSVETKVVRSPDIY